MAFGTLLHQRSPVHLFYLFKMYLKRQQPTSYVKEGREVAILPRENVQGNTI